MTSRRGRPWAFTAPSGRIRCICPHPSSSPPAWRTQAITTSRRGARQNLRTASPTCPRSCSHDRALVADGRNLPSLPALLSGHKRRRNGDLRGIERRLDYLSNLGIDAIWIAPTYPSPMADFGYDVANYCGVDAHFGTLADFDDLLAQAHAHGIK